MTLVDDPPTNRSALATERTDVVRSALRPSGWRLAARLARREVRRRRGRTALVAALIALPILAMTLAVTVAKTQQVSAQQSFERIAGQSDVYATSYDGKLDPVRVALPEGTRTVDMISAYTQVSAPGLDAVYVEFRVMPLDDPLLDGIVEIRDGRAPRAPGEVLLQADVARKLGVSIGDSFELERPSGEWTVVGIGRANEDFNRSLFVVSDFPSQRLRPEAATRTLFADLPEATTDSELGVLSRTTQNNGFVSIAPDLRPAGSPPRGWSVWGAEPTTTVPGEALAWGWVAGALALVAVGIIAAAAFASSARRQLTTIGQLSANGAPAGLIRRTLGLQGAWTGLFGSIAGITVALVALPFSRSLIERLVARPLGAWDIDVVALLVIVATGVAAATIAALVPARSASRIPVLAALAGRRPLGTVPRRLVPIGLGSFAAGVGLLVLVTAASTGSYSGNNDTLYAAAAIIGGLLVLGGMCCASPVAIDLVGRVGARLSGTWRLAARSSARSRTRSAGVLTAIAVTGAAAIAVTTAVGSLALGDESRTPIVPYGTVVLTSFEFDFTPPPGGSPEDVVNPTVRVVPFDDGVVERIAQIVPGADVSPRRVGIPAWPTDVRESAPSGLPATVMIADQTTRNLLGMSARDTEALDRDGVLDTAGWYNDDGTNDSRGYTTTVPGADGDLTIDIARPQDPLGSRGGEWGWVVTEERAAELGLDVVDAGFVVRSPQDLTRDQRDALGDLQQDLWQEQGFDVFVEPGDPSVEQINDPVQEVVNVTWDSTPSTFPRALLDAAALVAALLFTLLVVAIGLSLAATESRDERDVLLAIGATPRTMRGLAGTKATVLTAAAGVLAIPTGFLPVAAVLRAAPSDNRITFPWLTAIGLLVAIPTIAGLAALAASAIGQRFRPLHMSTLTED